MYLGAATKGKNANESTKPQYYGDHIPARKRNFSFKQSYMNYILKKYVLEDAVPFDHIISKEDINEEKTFEEIVLERLLKILESVKFVEKRISKYSNFKLNSRSEPSPLHSEMQICAIVASVFFLKYASIDINDEEKLESFSLHLDSLNDEWKTKHENQLKKHLAKRYIMEILQGRCNVLSLKYWTSGTV